MIDAPLVGYVLLKKFCEITGDTPQAVRDRLCDGIWQLGGLLEKDRLGRLHVNVEAYNSWVKGDQPAAKGSKPFAQASASGSPMGASGSPSPYTTAQPKLTFAKLGL